MIIKTKGIVLRSKKYAETSVIIDVFTEEKGMRSYIISGVRTPKAKTSSGLLQVMSILDIVAYHRDDQDLTRVKEIKAHHIYSSIPFDVKKSAIGLFITEVARRTIRGNEAWPEMFYFLLSYFVFLDKNQHYHNLHLHFLVRLTGHLGFLPGGEYSLETPLFDLTEGVFCKSQPAHDYWLNSSLAEKLNHFLNSSLEDCYQIITNRKDRSSFLDGLLIFYRLHIDNFPKIQSHSILEEVFS